MKTCIYWGLCILLVASCQSKTDQPNNNTSQDTLTKKKEPQEAEQPEYVKAITQQKMKATLQDYCEKLNNESYEAAIRDNFAPKVGQYIGMRNVTAGQIAAEVNRFLSQKKQVSYQVALDKLKVNGYLATVPLSFSWEGYYAKVLLELSFDANYKIAFYKETKILDKAVVQFIQREFFGSYNDCEPHSKGCVHYKLSYPEIIKAPAYLRNSLPKKPTTYGSPGMGEIHNVTSPEAVVDTLHRWFSTSPIGNSWWIEDVTTLKETKRLVTIENTSSWFVGQAYAEHYVRIDHYDKRTGKKIDLEDLLINDSLEDFEQVAFQVAFGDKEDDEVSRDRFYLSGAFKILDDGIQLCYSHAIGLPKLYLPQGNELMVPYEKFKYIIRKDGLLKDKIRGKGFK
ncbi:MAG TPA: hypothetical protein DCS93_04460 [Microscillaceae bacterium]|nr:hypothetical protein [Microscillaceae bacterium]